MEDDYHLCIKCKQTFYGLENYVTHRKEKACDGLPLLEESSRTAIDVSKDEREESGSLGMESEESEDENIYRPPKGYTKGKWRPGQGPVHLHSGSLSRHSDSDIQGDPEDCPLVLCNAQEPDTSLTFLPNQSKVSAKVLHSVSHFEGEDTGGSNSSDPRFSSPKTLQMSTLLERLLNENGDNSIQPDSQTETNWNKAVVEVEINLTKNLPFVCDICPFYATQMNSFAWHLNSGQHKDKEAVASEVKAVIVCRKCDKTCLDITSLLSHFRDEKTSLNGSKYSRTLFCCSFSLKERIEKIPESKSLKKPERIFRSVLQQKRHKIKRQVIRKSSREVCASNSKESHRNAVSVAKKYECSKCDQMFSAFREFKLHVNLHTNDSKDYKDYKCKVCGKIFVNQSYLSCHEKRHDPKEKVCPICGACFFFAKSLAKHLSIHEMNRKRPYLCDVCGASHLSPTLLRQHLKRHQERMFRCDQKGCGYAFVERKELLQHEKVHSEAKPFLCDKCPYRAKSVYSFRKHYRTHTHEKPFKCTLCKYQTGLSSNLSRHLRVHTQEKPYHCPYCEYVCSSHENFRKHILKTKKHQGLQVYPCRDCDFSTNEFPAYREHILTDHPHLQSLSSKAFPIVQ